MSVKEGGVEMRIGAEMLRLRVRMRMRSTSLISSLVTSPPRPVSFNTEPWGWGVGMEVGLEEGVAVEGGVAVC